jgi:hypothetical protein
MQKAKGETMADKVEWQFDVPISARSVTIPRTKREQAAMKDEPECRVELPGGGPGVFAKCGKWIAELGYDPYSEDLVIVKYMDNAPAYWGQDKVLPEPENAVALIDAMSKIMVRGLECSQHKDCRCQLVYVASLNEGDFKHVHEEKPLSVGLHFWLLPRYQHDNAFLETLDLNVMEKNDGFALMAEWRKQFLLNPTFAVRHLNRGF